MTVPVEDVPVSDLSTWDDSAPSSPLLKNEQNLVKSKVNLEMLKSFIFKFYCQGMFDLSKFMVGSDRESIKSDHSMKTGSTKRIEEIPQRQDSCTPPPKPPRIYDTAEGVQSPHHEVGNIVFILEIVDLFKCLECL